VVNDLGLNAYVIDVGMLGHAKPKMLGVYAPSVPLKELRTAIAEGSAFCGPIELIRISGMPLAHHPRRAGAARTTCGRRSGLPRLG
jgi:hypothetical protein